MKKAQKWTLCIYSDKKDFFSLCSLLFVTIPMGQCIESNTGDYKFIIPILDRY